MKQFRLLACLLPLALNPLRAAELNKVVPDHADFYLEVRNWAQTSRTWEASHAYKAWQSAEMKPIRDWMGKLWDEEVAKNADTSDDKVTPKLKEMTSYLRGNSAFVIMDMDRFIGAMGKLFKDMRQAAPGNDEDAQDVAYRPVQADAGDKEEEEEFDEDLGGPEIPDDQLPSFALVFELGGKDEDFTRDMNELVDLMISASAEEDKDSDVKTRKDKGELEGFAFNTVVEVDGDTTTTNFVWAVSGGVGMIGNQPANLALLAANLAKGTAVKPLASHPEYARAENRLENADAMFFLNLTSLMTSLENLAKQFNDPIPMAGGSVAQMVKRLDLPAMLPLTSGLKLVPDGIAMTADIGFSRETALSKVMLPYGREKADLPEFVPAEVISASSSRVSVSAWYQSLESLLTTFSPQMGMMMGIARNGVSTKYGIDYKTDLLDHLGDSLVMVEHIEINEKDAGKGKPGDEEEEELPPDNPFAAMFGGSANRVFAVSLKDKAAFQGTLDKLLAKAGEAADAIEKKEYLGQVYFEMANQRGPAGMKVAYAFLGDYLVFSIGDQSLLQAMIRSHQKPGKSAWSDERLKKYLAEAEGTSVAVQVTQVKTLVAQIIKGARLEAAENGEDVPNLEPLGKVFGNSAAVSRQEGNRLSTDGILWYADDAK